MEMMTPLPVPTHRRFPPIRRAVMRTKEKPSLPVPANDSRPRAQWEVTAVTGKLQISEFWEELTCTSPSILLTYGSMSTSWRCWCVCAW